MPRRCRRSRGRAPIGPRPRRRRRWQPVGATASRSLTSCGDRWHGSAGSLRFVVTRRSLIGALRREGMRITAPREAICAVLAEPDLGHVSVAELQQRAEQVLGRGIDLSTVYRTVDALQERSEEHTFELQSRENLVCRLLLEKKKGILAKNHTGGVTQSSLSAS